jgi:anti-sigma-K factor RskA
MTHAIDIHALAGAYALDAVNDIERAAFARHMTDCSACALEVAELQATSLRLADLTTSAPTPRLRDSVLAEISRTPQERARHTRGAAGGAVSRPRWRRLTAAAVAAGVIAVGAGAGTWMVTDQRARQEHAQLAAERQIVDVLTAPDAQTHRKAMGGGEVTVVVSPSRNKGAIVLTGLAKPPAGKQYELWLLTGTTGAASQGLVPVGENGTTVYLNSVGAADAFGLSVEQPGGSPTHRPTTGQVIDTLALR